MFTDGSCRGNPGPGGWAVLLRMGGKEREVSGGEKLTTNNRMELLAAIRGLSSLAALISAAGVLGQRLRERCRHRRSQFDAARSHAHA